VLKRISISALLLIGLLTTHAQGRQITELRSTNPAPTLRMLDGPLGNRLVIFKNGQESGSIRVPVPLSTSAIANGLESISVHPNGNDVAAGFKSEKGSFVVVFLLQVNRSYLGVDVSAVEAVNIGAIGPHRTYKTVETAPAGWIDRPRNDDAVQLFLQTRAWDVSGKRYTMNEPLIVTRGGKPLWR